MHPVRNRTGLKYNEISISSIVTNFHVIKNDKEL